MVAESPAKLKAKALGGGGGYLPLAMPSSRPPYLYPFKLPLVVCTLTALAIVALSPWPAYQQALWLLVFFSSCSLASVICQAIRMVNTLLIYRRLYVHGGHAAQHGSGGSGGGLSPTCAPCSSSSGSNSPPLSGAASPSKALGPGKASGLVVVEAVASGRPGHKKALRSKAGGGPCHRPALSLDAVDSCCDQAESLALVIDCEGWSESSSGCGSGSDWAAGPPRWNHVFVIPNYKEDMATLNATLEALRSHGWAGSYTVLLAMEAKEAGAVAKAAALQASYGCCFASVVYTLHEAAPGEMPGKASNVNAAVRQYYASVAGDRSSYMLTIMDADALVPFEYVQQLESVSGGAAHPGGNIYAAPVLFEQDASAVPGIVRATDYMWSALAAQNLNSWFGVGFPISNYSLSLKLAHDIGYWDTWPDAIGEDMHCFIKAFLRTQGAARLLPLHAPINMCHIAGATYLQGLWARFLQAERHMRGIADTAYLMHEWGSCAGSLRKVVMFVACLEAHLVPVVTLTSLVLLPVHYNLFMLATTHALPSPGSLPLPMRVLGLLGQGNLVFVVVIVGCYEAIRRIVRRHVYRQLDNDKHERCWWWCPRYVLHVLNYLTLFVSVWVYTVVPVVLVIGKHMLNVTSTNYVVADKRPQPRSGS